MAHLSWIFQNSLYVSNLDVAYYIFQRWLYKNNIYVYIHATYYSYNVTNTPFTKKRPYISSPWIWVGSLWPSALTNSECQKWCYVTSRTRSSKEYSIFLVLLGILDLGNQLHAVTMPKLTHAEWPHREPVWREGNVPRWQPAATAIWEWMCLQKIPVPGFRSSNWDPRQTLWTKDKPSLAHRNHERSWYFKPLRFVQSDEFQGKLYTRKMWLWFLEFWSHSRGHKWIPELQNNDICSIAAFITFAF